VGVRGVVQVHDEPAVFGGPGAVFAFRRKGLVRAERIALFAVFRERVGARTRNVRLVGAGFSGSFPGCDEPLLAFASEAH